MHSAKVALLGVVLVAKFLTERLCNSALVAAGLCR